MQFSLENIARYRLLYLHLEPDTDCCIYSYSQIHNALFTLTVRYRLLYLHLQPDTDCCIHTCSHRQTDLFTPTAKYRLLHIHLQFDTDCCIYTYNKRHNFLLVEYKHKGHKIKHTYCPGNAAVFSFTARYKLLYLHL